MRDTITTWLAAGLLATAPISAGAAGLGKLTVHSALGQPLNAEVDLLAVQKDDLASLSAHLASPEAFREARINPVSALSGLKFNIEQRPGGRTVLRITSSQPVSDPFIDMLVELSWASGRLVREFTVLLDPPGREEATKPAAPVAASTEATPKSAPAAEPGTAAESNGKPAAAAPKARARYGPVKAGETLHGIAGALKSHEATLDQMLVGLYRENPSAFFGKNMNRLKRGAVLKVPGQDKVGGVSRAEAMREVKLHAADWNVYRQAVASAAEATPEEPEATAGAKAAGTVTPKVHLPPAAEPARDVLKLSKPEAPKDAGPDAQRAAEAQAKLAAMQEQATAREKAVAEANERIVMLERNIREMQKLLEMKNQALMDLQKKPAPPAEPEVGVKPKAAPPATPEAGVKPEAAPPATPEAGVKPEAAPPAPEVARPAPKVTQPASPLTPSAPAAVPWYQSFLANPMYVAGGTALVLLGGVAWLVVQGNRRRRGLTSFEDSIMTGGELRSTALMKSPTGGDVDTGSTSFLTDFSQAGLGAIDSHDVDPIAEAEVYMAYGRDAQAEEILKEAMTRDPSRHEIHLKLLEIYAARKNAGAFETVATELYATLGGQPSPAWDKAAELGHQLDPSNPLYNAASIGAVAAATHMARAIAAMGVAEAEVLSFDAHRHEAKIAPTVREEEATAVQAMAEEAIMPAQDLDFALPAQTPVDEQPVEITEGPATFDFEELTGVGETIQAEAVEEPAAAQAETPGDFDFHPEVVAEQPVEKVAQEMQPLDFSGIDLNLDEVPATAPAAEPTAEPAVTVAEIPAAPAPAPAAAAPTSIDPELWQEVATKLDLARAYVEMGDGEGAREILQEVLGEGDAGQRGEAGKMLASLG